MANKISDQQTPQAIVEQLDRYVIGQGEAKRALAIALRSRWRRLQVDDALRMEITPKNILMIGPTGVGKTELARRLAKLSNAPFLKIEATKFTEVGYVGRDVESIIRELVDISVKMVREQAKRRVTKQASQHAEERILDALLPPSKPAGKLRAKFDQGSSQREAREMMRKKLKAGELDDREIEIALSNRGIGIEIMSPPGMEELTDQLQGMFQSLSADRSKVNKVTVKDAWKKLRDEEASKLINEEELKQLALEQVEQNGIVFIDEIDKVTKRSDYGNGSDVSREGVQRDLLPLVEGCSVATKHGIIKTDHILFIASGAFHLAKPSDLVPELQGRLPIRVELSSLGIEEFVRILGEPDASLIKQYTALLATENIRIHFTKAGIQRIAALAYQVNEMTENIGARRLHTIMERLLEKISFEAGDGHLKKVRIDRRYVDAQLHALVGDEDLSRYIL